MRIASIAAGLAILGLAPARADADTTATVLAVGGTALPVAGFLSIPSLPQRAEGPMLVASVATLLVAPSAGHFYAGEYLSTGFQIRIGGGAAVGVGTAIMFGCIEGHSDAAAMCTYGGYALAVAGIATMAVGAVHDIATAHDAGESSSAKRGTRMFSIGGRF
jgi:hypothetical protein